MDYTEAVPKIIDGREFDNGIICSGEQTVILPEELYDDIIREFEKRQCFYIEDKATKDKVADILFPGGIMNKDLVGMPATKVAELAGIEVPEDTRVILLKADGPGAMDILSKEKMCPVISTYKYKTFKDAIDIAQSNLDIDGRGHSVSIHSNNVANIEMAAEILTVSRVLINQICSTMNGGSFFNSLAPTTTLGCASWGGNSISENFDYKHLLNITRIAYFLKDNKVPTDKEIWGE
jgi:succinate-semialdehyde dehydrogenase